MQSQTASLVAAQLFNQGKGHPVPMIYGAVTNGTNWRFLMLDGTTAMIDAIEYYGNQMDQVLGILLLPFQPALNRAIQMIHP
jgi:hypothetical protein